MLLLPAPRPALLQLGSRLNGTSSTPAKDAEAPRGGKLNGSRVELALALLGLACAGPLLVLLLAPQPPPAPSAVGALQGGASWTTRPTCVQAPRGAVWEEVAVELRGP